MRKLIHFFLFAFGSASAAPITFQFTGFVTQVPVDDFGTGIQFLDPFQGTYTFDSNTPDSFPADSSIGVYDSITVAAGMTVDIGSNHFSTMGSQFLNVSIQNSSTDSYNILAENFVSPGLIFSIHLEDPTGAAFSSDALPLNPPGLSAFNPGDFTLSESDLSGNELEVLGHLSSLETCTSLCASAVPEPRLDWFAAAAAGLLAWARARRRCQGFTGEP